MTKNATAKAAAFEVALKYLASVQAERRSIPRK